MTIRWAPSARRKFENALAYLFDHSPKGARRVERDILHAISLLDDFPHLAPASRHRGLRQKVVARTPYLVIYRVVDDIIEIRAVIHAKRKRRR